MVLEPVEVTSIPSGNPALGIPNVVGNNPMPALMPTQRMITQKTILSTGLTRTTGGISKAVISGFTTFVNGVPTKGTQHSCQGNGGASCSCGGNCTVDNTNIPIPQSMQALTASNGRPTLEQIISAYGKLSLVSKSISTTPSIDPPISQRIGPCYQILHYFATEPGNDAFDVWVIVPCDGILFDPGWGIGLPPGFPGNDGKPGTQLIDPPPFNSGPGQEGNPIDRISFIGCTDYSPDFLSSDDSKEQALKTALKADFQKIIDADKPGGAFDKLKGCSGANSLIRCLKSQVDNPQIKSIECKDFPPGKDGKDSAKAMSTDHGNITVNPKLLGQGFDDEHLMHELMHICNASELDSYMMTFMFFNDRPKKFTIKNGIRTSIENDKEHPTYSLMNGFIAANQGAFAWNPDTGEIKCMDKLARGQLGKSLFPPGTIFGH
jgi:hypothetical protein